MSTQRDIRDLRKALHPQLPFLIEHYGVRSLALFGSYVRGEARLDSDLDILVTFDQVPSLLRFIELENYLSDHLGVKVDLVMRDALKPGVGQHILQEVVPI